MTKHLLPDIKIRKVLIRYYNNDFACLEGLSFYDSKNKLIFKIGKKVNTITKEIILADDE